MKKKDGKNQGFLIQVKDVIEPLNYKIQVVFEVKISGVLQDTFSGDKTAFCNLG